MAENRTSCITFDQAVPLIKIYLNEDTFMHKGGQQNIICCLKRQEIQGIVENMEHPHNGVPK
jgi:hypothetical protein